MAQTGFTPIQLYSSSTATNVPLAANLATGELAINITDGKLFYKDNTAAVQVIGWKTTPTTAGGTGLTSYTAGDTVYYATGTTLSKLSIGANTTIMTSSGSAPQWTAASSISIGTATNLAGGAAGSVPYQTGAGATSLLAIGTAYQAFQVNAGATAPSWQPSATSVMTAQGDLLYASGANTLARLAKDSNATRYLSNTGTTNNPAWAQINLSNGVTGTLPTANGGTNLTSFTANGVVYASSASALTTGSSLVFDGANLGVGTTPSAWGSGRPAIEMNSSVSAYIVNNNTGAFQLQNNSYYDGATNVAKVTGAGSSYSQYQGDHYWYSMASVSAGATQTFNQNMTLNAAGNFLVGTASALGSGKVGFLQSASGQVLTMQNSNAAPYGIVCAYTGAAPNSTISQFIYCDDTVGLKMEVRSNGGIANYAANNVILSDRREKTNFAPAGSYLDKICAIPVQTFNYIDQNLEEDAGLTLGVVAQDVQAVAPELVTEGNWGSKEEPKMRFEIYQTDLQYALMKCIQEQQALIESLTTRLTALESK
jgi:hypothetical protein